MDKKSDDVLRVVLADDHQMVRSGIAALLGTVEGVEVVGQASNGLELLALVDQLSPGLVITDISMPKMNGMEALAQLKRTHPKLPVVILSMHDGPEVLKIVTFRGAAGYVKKDSSRDELLRVITTVRDAGFHRPEKLRRAPRPKPGSATEPLTARQIEILQMIAKGMASKEIGFELGLSPKTVDVHRARIMARTGCRDIPSLTLYAIRAGLIEPSS